MRQTDELSRVKARIKALTEKTIANGCTEAEAMAAAEMVGRLLERYALSMDAIEILYRPVRSGRGADWRSPAATDRWLCASDRPLL